MKMAVKGVVLDAIGTVFSLQRMRRTLASFDAPDSFLDSWFPSLLRDAFALQLTGRYRPFGEIAGATLCEHAERAGLQFSEHDRESILACFSRLDPHPDIKPGLGALQRLRLPVYALTNGDARNTEALITRGGLDGLIEKALTVEDVQTWKPHRRVYEYCCETMNMEPGSVLLAAAHPWDINGAAAAGMRTAFINRNGSQYPHHMNPPDLIADGLSSLAGQLTGERGGL